jgi:TPR repeat protein
MLTGEAAYRKMPVEKIFAAKLSGQQLALPTHLADYQSLLDRMLASDRSQRHQTSEEIVTQIDALVAGANAAPAGTRNAITAVVLVVALAGLGLTAYRALWVQPEQVAVTGMEEVAIVQPVGPGVAEYHLYLDIVTGKNPVMIEDFLQQFPDSPLRVLVLAIGGDETTPIDQIVSAADGGDAVSQVVMSELLDQGWLGLEQDSTRALQYATEAAASGYSFGRYVLAEQLLVKDAPLEEVMVQLQAAAEDGSYQAQNLLGSMLLGSEDTADLAQGVKWLRSGSEQGYRIATANLAVAYRDGIGVAKNAIIADELFDQAAELGDLEVRKMLLERQQ